MYSDKPLNIFYEEPDPDRWFKYDRYPRKLIRRIFRGKERPGGVMMIAINLMKGLDKIGVTYRFNDYRYIKQHPEEIACIIGKPQVLFEKKWLNPVILGAGIYSHPIEIPNLFEKYPNVKRFLVPGDWMVKMFEPFYKFCFSTYRVSFIHADQEVLVQCWANPAVMAFGKYIYWCTKLVLSRVMRIKSQGECSPHLLKTGVKSSKL